MKQWESESIYRSMQIDERWKPYALFRSWIDGRRFGQDMANEDDDEVLWRMRKRKGWYVVERRKAGKP